MPSFKFIILLYGENSMKCVLSKLIDILFTFDHSTRYLISFKFIILLYGANTMKYVLSKLIDILFTFDHSTRYLISSFTISMTSRAFYLCKKVTSKQNIFN